MPGFGSSDGLGEAFTVGDIGSVIGSFVDQVALRNSGAPVHIFGVHNGAVVAAEVARVFPEMVKSATLVGFPYVSEAERNERIQWVDDHVQGRPGGLPLVIPDETGSYLTRRWHKSAEIARWDRPRETLRLSAEQVDFANQLVWMSVAAWDAIAQAFRATFTYDADRLLPHVGVPTLVAHLTGPFEGEHSKRSDTLARLIPDSRVAPIDLEGAYFYYWHPQVVRSLLEAFWDTLG